MYLMHGMPLSQHVDLTSVWIYKIWEECSIKQSHKDSFSYYRLQTAPQKIHKVNRYELNNISKISICWYKANFVLFRGNSTLYRINYSCWFTLNSSITFNILSKKLTCELWIIDALENQNFVETFLVPHSYIRTYRRNTYHLLEYHFILLYTNVSRRESS